MPEVRDWSGARRAVLYRPVKPQMTLRVDADVVEWFTRAREGEGYQTNINRALREYICSVRTSRRGANAASRSILAAISPHERRAGA